MPLGVQTFVNKVYWYRNKMKWNVFEVSGIMFIERLADIFWESDHRSTFSRPPAHLHICAVTNITEILLNVTLSYQFNNNQSRHVFSNGVVDTSVGIFISLLARIPGSCFMQMTFTMLDVVPGNIFVEDRMSHTGKCVSSCASFFFKKKSTSMCRQALFVPDRMIQDMFCFECLSCFSFHLHQILFSHAPQTRIL